MGEKPGVGSQKKMGWERLGYARPTRERTLNVKVNYVWFSHFAWA
jgi:hypothetical protein